MATPHPRVVQQLANHVPPSTLALWTQRLAQQSEPEPKQVNTPATNCTASSFHKQGGSAIQRQKRNRKPQTTLVAAQQPAQQQPDNLVDEKETEGARVVAKGRAVFFGKDCQLPYLHSSDAISYLHARRPVHADQEIPLFNPPSSIEPSRLTNLRALLLYHVPIESLRQLGTGWGQLKQVSAVFCRLNDLSGINSFCSLEYLFVSFNFIANLADVMMHPALRCIDLEGNKIQQIDELQFLLTVEGLENVNLAGNPLMTVTQTRRKVQQKMGKLLEAAEYTRLVEYEMQEMEEMHQLTTFEGVETSNALLSCCQKQLNSDEITLSDLRESYSATAPQQSPEIVTYSQPLESDTAAEGEEEHQEEPHLTPLTHFLPYQQLFHPVLDKYLHNRVYLSIKNKPSHSPSPSHSLRAAHHQLSTQQFLPSRQQTTSLEQPAHSVDRTRPSRLSLSKPRRLLDPHHSKQPVGSAKGLTSTGATTPLGSKTFTLKRGSLLRKAPEETVGGRFTQTGPLARHHH